MTVRRRPVPRPSRCLLAVALLFGIVLMHGLGHPGEHAVPELSGGHAAMAPHASDAPMEQPVTAEPPHRTAPPAPAHGAGVTTLCLAVLGAGIGLLLAVRAGPGRSARAGAPPPAASRLTYALRPNPPPAAPGSLLTRLSSLRI
ncbi:hypothetical protein [Streptomyces sp. PTD5-9]|uniref:hypothetical protein n=1 Tax=Streptomyces sp. PTD5-9 TaxID=3120150 RepID=UPI00300B2233